MEIDQRKSLAKQVQQMQTCYFWELVCAYFSRWLALPYIFFQILWWVLIVPHFQNWVKKWRVTCLRLHSSQSRSDIWTSASWCQSLWSQGLMLSQSEYPVQSQIQDPQNSSHLASIDQLYLIVVAFNNDLFGSSVWNKKDYFSCPSVWIHVIICKMKG